MIIKLEKKFISTIIKSCHMILPLYLYEEFLKNNNQNQCLQFFQKVTPWLPSYVVNLHSSNQGNKPFDVDIYKNIPDKIASDLTLFNLVKDAEDAGYIIKNQMPNDSRSVSIAFEKEAFKEIADWLKGLNIKKK